MNRHFYVYPLSVQFKITNIFCHNLDILYVQVYHKIEISGLVKEVQADNVSDERQNNA